jgi:small-conductance mechanosensitive channel
MSPDALIYQITVLEGDVEKFIELLLGFKSVIGSAALIAGVIMALGVLNKVLQKNATEMSGKRFRNQLIMSAALFCGLVIIILGLPISSAKQGQLLTLIGILLSVGISLSSSTILSNAMAGIMLKTVRSFRSGDFVHVENHFGRVTERGLFHTEIQTADRDLITLPNLFLANKPVKVVRSSGTVISASVSLGYDVPQARIKELLLGAAEEVGLQEPFVQVLELGDYSVTYRTAGLLEETKRLITYRSRLRSAMLDALHGGGVEIVSPGFMNIRDFDPDRHFIPAPVRAHQAETTDAAPVEMVFDKAEVAASLAELKKHLAEADEALKEARQMVKDAADKEAKAAAESRVAEIERNIENLNRRAATAKEQEKIHED